MYKVGTGATKIMHSDRHPYTVVEVLSHRRIKLKADKPIRTDKNSMSECQSYMYDLGVGEEVIVSLRKDGTWRAVGSNQLFHIGSRREYHDYSF